MKKLMVFLSFLMVSSLVIAQPPGGGGRSPEQMKQRMKERNKQPLMEKAKLTDAQAEKVIDVYFETRGEGMKIMRNEEMTKEEKDAKMKDLMTARDKKLKDAGLTDDQIKAVSDYFEEQRKQMSERRDGAGEKPRE